MEKVIKIVKKISENIYLNKLIILDGYFKISQESEFNNLIVSGPIRRWNIWGNKDGIFGGKSKFCVRYSRTEKDIQECKRT